MIGQGLVLMAAGMGIVYLFLIMLIFVTKLAMAGVSRFDSILPDAAPKAKPRAAAEAGDGENVALAIAVAMQA